MYLAIKLKLYMPLVGLRRDKEGNHPPLPFGSWLNFKCLTWVYIIAYNIMYRCIILVHSSFFQVLKYQRFWSYKKELNINTVLVHYSNTLTYQYFYYVDRYLN